MAPRLRLEATQSGWSTRRNAQTHASFSTSHNRSSSDVSLRTSCPSGIMSLAVALIWESRNVNYQSEFKKKAFYLMTYIAASKLKLKIPASSRRNVIII